MRGPAVVLLALLAAACAGGPPPSVDGLTRPATVWRPPEAPRAVIVALHGFNDHRTAFDEFAAWAAGRGILVEAYDQRGFGENADRGYWAGTDAMVDDLRAAIARQRADHPGVPLYLLGESMGAAVIAVAMARPDAPPVEGIVMTAPATWGGDAMNPFYRATLWTARQLAPGLTLSGRGLGRMASDNIPMLRGLGADPLVIKETRIDALAGLVDLMGEARAAGPRLPGPILVVIGANDDIEPPDVQLDFTARLTAQPCTLVWRTDGWHLLLRDLEREQVWQDIADWIDGRQPAGGRVGPCADALAVAGAES